MKHQKNKNISNLIADASIHNALFINSNLKKEKLAPTVKDSINLADTALQNVFINSKVTPETKNRSSNKSQFIRYVKDH